VDVVTDHGLAGALDRWPVILVPEWELLPPGLVTELADYARRGGNLLIAGARTAGLFREHLGAELIGEPAEAEAHLQIEGRFTGGDTFGVPMRGIWQEVRTPEKRAGSSRGGVRVLAHRTSGRHPEPGRMVAATLAALGRGKIAAVYGPLASNHWRMHTPALRDFVGAVLGRLYRPIATLDFGEDPAAPRTVDLVLRRKDGRLIVHLNNVAQTPTASESYMVNDRVPPVGPLRLDLRLDA
jgi:hypothetical protein